MKKYRLILLLSLLFQGCDRIQEENYLIDYTPPVTSGENVRNILLEDYTGVNCSGCPTAAEKAAILKEVYKERLIVVAIHAGSYARPTTGYDLRTPAGNEYNSYFKVSGNPQGIMNRMPYKGQPFYVPDQWDQAITTMPSESPYTILMNIDYVPDTRHYRVALNIGKSASITDPLNLIIWLVEDKIVTSQTIGGGIIVPDYVQRHVFRGALNETWGEPIAWTDSSPDALTLTKEYQLPEKFKAENCSVVALLCNPDTKEVLQVQEKEIEKGIDQRR